MKKEISLDYNHKRRVIWFFSIFLVLMLYFFQNSSFLLRAVTSLEFLILFYLIDHFFNVRFLPRHYVYIFVIAIVSILLSPLYFVYPSYDKVQHFVQPMLICSIIFFIVSKLKLELKWKLIFAFLITFSILGLFEIGEYVADNLFNLKLQGVYLRDLSGFKKFNLVTEPLDDTMQDLILGFLGSGLYTLANGFYLKRIKKR